MTKTQEIVEICLRAIESGNIPQESESFSFYGDVIDVIQEKNKEIIKLKERNNQIFGDQKEAKIMIRRQFDYFCPVCRFQVLMTGPHNFCGKCGQALKEE